MKVTTRQDPDLLINHHQDQHHHHHQDQHQHDLPQEPEGCQPGLEVDDLSRYADEHESPGGESVTPADPGSILPLQAHGDTVSPEDRERLCAGGTGSCGHHSECRPGLEGSRDSGGHPRHHLRGPGSLLSEDGSHEALRHPLPPLLPHLPPGLRHGDHLLGHGAGQGRQHSLH